MSKKMLIDASHAEETRVVVLDGSKVEEFDFESAAKRPIRGNIYLAKVTRVEPSLQAAFVEYGGNRHGFLAFNEIHPDYYQIPHEDRMALQAEIEAEIAAQTAEDEAEDAAKAAKAGAETDASEQDAAAEAKPDADETAADASDDDGETSGDNADDASDDSADNTPDESAASDDSDADDDGVDEAALERKRRNFFRKYKIQEVIKRRQILLVQVAKEERGNKGAALTTYLSLAGRYCVLMPNTPRGGGISRKISSSSDRKRLKGVVDSLDLPKGAGLIIRTAGASRTKTEIKRDADYLVRLWSQIREDTLKAVAPALIYAEGDLVKRAIRDMYDKDIESVLVEGEQAYKDAKAFIRMLMPSHARKVRHYRESVPLFLRHKAENQLEQIYSPVANLKSGGYIVINPTEALVSIDVNSGRATKERNIEATALKTNLEAAEEAARQMRLRDLAGLIVIDFIDMEESKNNRAVEKKMKEVLKRDRARLQMGRISQFGLMEISRQRRRTSLIEGSTTTCPTCKGAGFVRSVESSALVALRALEEEGLKATTRQAKIRLATATALYLLNEKRAHLLSIESRFEMSITVAADDNLMPPECAIDVLEQRKADEAPALPEPVIEEDDPADIAAAEAEAAEEAEEQAEEDGDREGSGGRRRRRRRRRRGGGSGEGDNAASGAASGQDEDGSADSDGEATDAPSGASDDSEDGAPRRRRRRGRRGGRGRRRNSGDNQNQADQSQGDQSQDNQDSSDQSAAAEAGSDQPKAEAAATPDTASAEAAPASGEDKPKRPRRRRTKADDKPAADASPDGATDGEADAKADAGEDKPAPKRRTRRKKADDAPADAKAENKPAEDAKSEDKPKRTRRKKAEAKPDEAAAEKPDAAATESAKPARSKEEAKETAEAGSDAKADGKAGEDKQPRRKGWWQFGR